MCQKIDLRQIGPAVPEINRVLHVHSKFPALHPIFPLLFNTLYFPNVYQLSLFMPSLNYCHVCVIPDLYNSRSCMFCGWWCCKPVLKVYIQQDIITFQLSYLISILFIFVVNIHVPSCLILPHPLLSPSLFSGLLFTTVYFPFLLSLPSVLSLGIYPGKLFW